MMTPAQLDAIGQVLAAKPAQRPLGGVQYVPAHEYEALLKAAQALYSDATAPPVPKLKA